MPGKFEAAISPADIMHRLRQLETRVNALATARSLEAATIGRGGLRVRGGRITIENTDGVETLTMSSSRLELLGQLEVTGDIMVLSGNNTQRARLIQGSLFLASGIESEGSGRIFAGTVDEGNRVNLQIIAPRLLGDSSNNRISIEGASPGLPDGGMFFITAGDAVWDVGGTVFLTPTSGDIVTRMENTTASANVWVGGTTVADNSLLRRITSSAASKVDVEDLDVDPAEVVSLRPRTWRDRGEVAADPETDRWHVGLIAEEVHAAGLTEFVDYDDDGNPVSVTYDRLVVALLAVVKQQQARLDALDGGSPRRLQRRRKAKRRPMRYKRAPAEAPPAS